MLKSPIADTSPSSEDLRPEHQALNPTKVGAGLVQGLIALLEVRDWDSGF